MKYATTRYICSLLSLDELLEMQRACMTLKECALHDQITLEEINAELERRIKYADVQRSPKAG